jgi:hypothetical protein
LCAFRFLNKVIPIGALFRIYHLSQIPQRCYTGKAELLLPLFPEKFAEIAGAQQDSADKAVYEEIQKVKWNSLAVGKCQQEEPVLKIGRVQMLCIRIFNGTYAF